MLATNDGCGVNPALHGKNWVIIKTSALGSMAQGRKILCYENVGGIVAVAGNVLRHDCQLQGTIYDRGGAG